MKFYQKKKNNPYILPQYVYMQAIYAVRDYERMKAEQSRLQCDESLKQIKKQELKNLSSRIDAIDSALGYVPEFYREPILNNINHSVNYPLGADVRTYQRYKQRAIYYVARNLKII